LFISLANLPQNDSPAAEPPAKISKINKSKKKHRKLSHSDTNGRSDKHRDKHSDGHRDRRKDKHSSKHSDRRNDEHRRKHKSKKRKKEEKVPGDVTYMDDYRPQTKQLKLDDNSLQV